MLNIVDENDNIIGEESREKIHKDGLLHREVHVWIHNGQGELLFQKRSKTKDTCPGTLDASVGGHVEIGDSYEKTALKELEEETGLVAQASDLVYMGKLRRNKFSDPKTGKVNNSYRAVYAFRYGGKAEDLRVEDGAADGFEFWPIDTILNLPQSEQAKFGPSILSEEYREIFRRIKSL